MRNGEYPVKFSEFSLCVCINKTSEFNHVFFFIFTYIIVFKILFLFATDLVRVEVLEAQGMTWINNLVPRLFVVSMFGFYPILNLSSWLCCFPRIAESPMSPMYFVNIFSS